MRLVAFAPSPAPFILIPSILLSRKTLDRAYRSERRLAFARLFVARTRYEDVALPGLVHPPSMAGPFLSFSVEEVPEIVDSDLKSVL